MNIHKKALKDGLKGKGACPNVKAGDRRYYQWQDTQDESSDPLSDTIALINWSDNNIILDHICEEAGGCFVKYEAGGKTSKTAMVGLSTVLKEITDVFTAGSDLIDEDGKITSTKKVEALKKEAKEAVQAIAAFITDIEAHRYL